MQSSTKPSKFSLVFLFGNSVDSLQDSCEGFGAVGPLCVVISFAFQSRKCMIISYYNFIYV